MKTRKIVDRFKRFLKGKSQNAQTSINLFSTVVVNVVTFASSLIFSGLLGTEGYGNVSLYVSYLDIFVIIATLQTVGSIGSARTVFDGEKIKQYDSLSLFISLLTLFIFSTISVFLAPFYSSLIGFEWPVILCIVIQSFGTYVVTFYTTRFLYEKNALKSFLISFGASILSLVFALGLILIFNFSGDSSQSYLGRLWGYAAIYGIFGFVLTILQFKRSKPSFDKQMVKYCFAISIPLAFHSLGNIVLSQSDKIMLDWLGISRSEIGVYSLMLTFGHVLNAIWSGLNNSWIPFYYDDMKARDGKNINSKTKNYIFVFWVLCTGFLFVAPEVIKLFASQGYWSGIDILPLIVFSSFMTFLYSFCVNYELFRKKSLFIMIGTILAATLNVFLNYFFIRTMSAEGAAIATAISYLALFVFHYIISRYILKKDFFFHGFYFAAGVVAIVISTLLFFVFKPFTYIRWTLFAILASALLVSVIKRRSIF